MVYLGEWPSCTHNKLGPHQVGSIGSSHSYQSLTNLEATERGQSKASTQNRSVKDTLPSQGRKNSRASWKSRRAQSSALTHWSWAARQYVAARQTHSPFPQLHKDFSNTPLSAECLEY